MTVRVPKSPGGGYNETMDGAGVTDGGDRAGGGGGRVGVFVTCLVNLMRPSIAEATLRLLGRCGAEPVVPRTQTCCGQPAYNNGQRALATRLAAKWARDFAGCDRVVAPSGSCAGMVRVHYPRLAEGAGRDRDLVAAAAGKCSELSEFLDGRGFVPAHRDGLGSVTYHDCCAGLRELGIGAAPRRMLRERGYRIAEMEEADACCGFGGTFSVKMGDISSAMADAKCDCAIATGAPALVMGDLGCILNVEGRLSRRGGGPRVLHLAEALEA